MSSLDAMAAAGLRILDLLTASEAALRLGCSADRVYRLAVAGELERERFGRQVRYTPESVAAYLARQAS